MTFRSNSRTLDLNLANAVARGYLAALRILGNPAQAESLVLSAVEGLDPARVDSDAIRDGVVTRLVEAQISRQDLYKDSGNTRVQ